MYCSLHTANHCVFVLFGINYRDTHFRTAWCHLTEITSMKNTSWEIGWYQIRVQWYYKQILTVYIMFCILENLIRNIQYLLNLFIIWIFSIIEIASFFELMSDLSSNLDDPWERIERCKKSAENVVVILTYQELNTDATIHKDTHMYWELTSHSKKACWCASGNDTCCYFKYPTIVLLVHLSFCLSKHN